MKLKTFTFTISLLVLFSSRICGQVPGDAITLDLSSPTNPPGFEVDEEKGHWTETYNDKDYPAIEFGIFSFTHIPGMLGGNYWDGFTYCTSGDANDYGSGSSSSGGWINNQWGAMAGGGIKTDAGGKVLKDSSGKVLVEKGIPYLTAFWGFFMEMMYNDQCLKTTFTDGNTYEPVGVYINNHPWAYYGVMHGDGFARPFAEGDYFKLKIHALDKNGNETDKYVEHVLAEFANGQLKQSPDWEWVDLSPLGEAGGLYYTMETTDINENNEPNTAVYFCLDKLQVRVPGGTTHQHDSNISKPAASIYPDVAAGYIRIHSEKAAALEIYALDGSKVHMQQVPAGITTVSTSRLQKGIYILRCGNVNTKIIYQ